MSTEHESLSADGELSKVVRGATALSPSVSKSPIMNEKVGILRATSICQVSPITIMWLELRVNELSHDAINATVSASCQFQTDISLRCIVFLAFTVYVLL